MNKKKLILITGSVAISIVYLLPFYILLTSAFKTPDDLSTKWFFPDYLYLDNFKHAWIDANMFQALLNNIFNTTVSVLLLVIVGSAASYPLARYKTKLNNFVYYLFVSMLIVPPLTILVPLYDMYAKIGAINTYWGIIVLLVTFYLPMTIFLYTGFIESIPKELDEAAMIDGVSPIGLFFRIIFPLLKPVTATVIIITGVFIWNDYQFSVFFLQETAMQTTTVALSKFFGTYNNQIGWVAAGSLIASIPVTILYLIFQKQFIEGLSSGAVK